MNTSPTCNRKRTTFPTFSPPQQLSAETLLQKTVPTNSHIQSTKKQPKTQIKTQMSQQPTRLIVIGGRNNSGPQRIVRTRPPLKFDRAFLEERGNQLKLVQMVKIH